MNRNSTAFLLSFLLAALFVIVMAGFTWPTGVPQSPVEYWKEWSKGNITCHPDELRLQKGFDAFFSLGKMSGEQRYILQFAHHKVKASNGTMIYQWSDMTHAHPNSEEGSRVYMATVDLPHDTIIEYSYGVIVD